MKRFLALGLASLLQIALADAAPKSGENTTMPAGLTTGGTQIECTTPDGRVIAVEPASDQNKDPAALIVNDDTLSCPLQEGETTFVIKVSSASLLDHFTFLNENATAAGHLKISVSNDPLPATSPKWLEVDGHIAFTKKRLFNLSMVGVEARYVKLSFRVDKAERIAALGGMLP